MIPCSALVRERVTYARSVPPRLSFPLLVKGPRNPALWTYCLSLLTFIALSVCRLKNSKKCHMPVHPASLPGDIWVLVVVVVVAVVKLTIFLVL